MEPLACKTIVFRAMTRKKWVDPITSRILPAAFVRRPAPQDEDGLSIDVQSPQSCVSGLKSHFGVGSLHVGRIRDLGLDITVDDAPHAVITGVPRESDDQARAEWFASQLAKLARYIAPEQMLVVSNV
jgi:hypothetical protein